jgi:hypothetical protein
MKINFYKHILAQALAVVLEQLLVFEYVEQLEP